MHTVASIQALLEPLLPGLMGVKLLGVSPNAVLAEMVVRADLCTTGGMLHGGACMPFADTVGAVGTLLNLPPGKGTTTTESSTKCIAAAPGGTTIRAESLALHRGRTTMVWQTATTDAQGETVRRGEADAARTRVQGAEVD